MPTDSPTWWTVLDAFPAWRPTIRVSTVDNAYEFPLFQHHDNAESLAKLAVIEGLRKWLQSFNVTTDYAPGAMAAIWKEMGVHLCEPTERALLEGSDADLITAALAVAAATNPIASPPPSEGHNPAASIKKPSGSGTYGQRGAEA